MKEIIVAINNELEEIQKSKNNLDPSTTDFRNQVEKELVLLNAEKMILGLML